MKKRLYPPTPHNRLRCVTEAMKTNVGRCQRNALPKTPDGLTVTEGLIYSGMRTVTTSLDAPSLLRLHLLYD